MQGVLVLSVGPRELYHIRKIQTYHAATSVRKLILPQFVISNPFDTLRVNSVRDLAF
jgi:hypothetical protein